MTSREKFFKEYLNLRTANEGPGENPIQMAGSDLCIPRNETVRTRCFQNKFIP